MDWVYLKSVSGDVAKGGMTNRHTKIKIYSHDFDIVKKFLLNQTEREFCYIKNDYSSVKAEILHSIFLDLVEELTDRKIFLNKYYARTTWELIQPS